MNHSYGYLDEGPHGEKVGQHGGEALSQAALGDEAKLELRKTNGVISLLPGPARDVQKVGLKAGKTKSLRNANCAEKRRSNKSFKTQIKVTDYTNLIVVLQHLSDYSDLWMVVLD